MNQPRQCGRCGNCGLVSQMTGCDMCDVWFHHKCAGIMDETRDPDKSWRCEKCMHDDSAEVTSQSKITIKTSSSRARRAELALKRLEEEQALQKKIREEEDELRKKEEEVQKKRAEEDAQFLKQKHELLQSLDDENASVRSGMSNRASLKKVQLWLGAQQGSMMPPAEKTQSCGPDVSASRVTASGMETSAILSTSGLQSGTDLLFSQKAVDIINLPKQSRPLYEGINASTTLPQVSAPLTSLPLPVATSSSYTNVGGYNSGHNIQSSSAISTTYLDVQSSLQLSGQISKTNVPFGKFGIASQFPTSSVSITGQMPCVVPSSLQVTMAPSHGGAPAGTNMCSLPTSGVPIPSVLNPTALGSVPAPIPSLPGLTTTTSRVACANLLGQQVSQPDPLMYGNGYPVVTTATASGSTSQQFSGPRQPTLASGQPFGDLLAPSGVQIAARQVMSRDLPTFSGDPQDWPLFSSSFYNSTAACGYTDAENLARLQRCLKGHALDSVKSRLLLPQSVPHVMETLRMLYGRPEILIHSLLQKLRNVPSPKAENLQSIITYGMAVRNLVDHMYVANLVEHLRNPMLVHELVEKLPPQLKMQWSWYKRNNPDVNLATFGEFMTELVHTATDVTFPVDVSTNKSAHIGGEKQKLFVHSEADGRQSSTISGNKPKPPQVPEPSKTCAYCSDEKHGTSGCPQFKALDLDGRWKAIRSKGLCRTCLIPHRKWPCRSGKECGVDGCRFRHHALLHSQVAAEPTADQSKFSESIARQNHHSATNYSLFRYLPVTLEWNGKKVNTFAFLDDGSSSTLLEAELAVELDIVGPEEPLWLAWTGNISREEKGSQQISVTISGSGLKSQFRLHNVRTVQKLNLQGQTFKYTELQKSYPHLRGLPLRSYTDAVPKMIIGIEHAQLLSSLKVREGRYNDPIAAKTRLGWCVYGKQVGGSSKIERLHFHSQEIGNRELHDMMKQYFSIEEAAVVTPLESEEDIRARKILESTTRRIEGRFETGLLWKFDQPSFPNSYPMAVSRMQSLERRLTKEPELRERVNAQVSEYETKGYAHRITEAELQSMNPDRMWYLPLGIVRNPKKPEKIRLIWDAAARVNGVSLNDMLLKGPDLLTSLFAVLLRFRQRPIAVSGDIREMFHQLKIIAQDKQSQMFVYREQTDQPPQIFVMDVATFGATCSPCSAQHVKNTNALDFAAQFPRAAEAIIKAHYVDDFLDSVDTIDEAIQLVNEVKYVHAQGGFDIRNFASNSSKVMQHLGETQSLQQKPLNLDKLADVERVLGMVWRPVEDIFSFDTTLKDDLVKVLIEGNIPTKRQVLRLVMSLFDPYGFIAHFIIHGKILMQHIWRSGTDWDEAIVEGLYGLWMDWTRLLTQLGEVKVPRCFFGGASSKLHSGTQLHMFVDASELAYACVAYLRIVQDGKVHCVIVAAKTKVAPLKSISIPRLELQAGLIGCRLMDNICTTLDLPIEKRFVWTDSRTCLSWVQSDSRRYHPYVSFRIGEILNISVAEEWLYVPSKQNVADEATKWGMGPNFSPNSRWYTGPSFLYLSKNEWPEQPAKQWPTEQELRVVYQHHREIPKPLIDVSRFSNWNRLQRATAYMQRAVKWFRKDKLSGPLTSDELLQAEILLWRQVQFQVFPDEYSALEYNKKHPEKEQKRIGKHSPLYELSPYLDDMGVIRMNSRIGNAPTASFGAKYPIILPKDHNLTALLVDSYHRRFKHQNRETVFNEIRQQFRIPNLRSLIKRVAKDCQHCKVQNTTPRPPMMAPLPQARLTPNIRAFSNTGIDYFGPMLVKQGRSLAKRWIALFTCLTTRAVHLEIVHSLSTQSCVMAIRRFVARRGSPLAFYSDNGTCFRGASNLLMEQILAINEDCAVTFTNARTSWYFNPPSAPHMGGSWERMVRSVKAAIGAIAEHPRHPSDEVLETVVLEAESIVNSRPLTYVPLDDVDQEALTPNHFLLYGTLGIVQPKTPMVNEGAALRDSWKLAQYLADEFWRRWVREYLPTLTRRTKWFEPVKPLEPGDSVIVIEANKRNGWVRGRIVEVIKTKDGQVRRAVVRTADGIMTRPAVKLASLDVCRPRNERQGSPESHGRGNVNDYQSGNTVEGGEDSVNSLNDEQCSAEYPREKCTKPNNSRTTGLKGKKKYAKQ